jgi:hypothetical protein
MNDLKQFVLDLDKFEWHDDNTFLFGSQRIAREFSNDNALLHQRCNQ